MEYPFLFSAIGTNDNQDSLIRQLETNNVLIEATTPNVLRIGEPTEIYIEIYDGICIFTQTFCKI